MQEDISVMNQALAAVSDVPAAENAATVPVLEAADEVGPGPWKWPGCA